MLAVSDENKKTVWKSYHEKKLLNTYFACNKNSLSKQMKLALNIP